MLIVAAGIILALFLFACSDDDDPPTSPPVATYTVSGTLTLPASVTDKQWYVAVDTDDDGSNGMIAIDSGLVTGSTVNYSIANIPAGDYFIYSEVDLTGNLGPWDSGDYVGMSCQLQDGSSCTTTIDSSTTIDIVLYVNP